VSLSAFSTERVAGWLRPAWVEVDLEAVADNVAHLVSLVRPARVCAVVKADGYGHGAVQVARAALAGGASHLGVALAEEGHQLRQAGIGAPVLVLSEPPAGAMGLVVEDRLTPSIYTEAGLADLAEAARKVGTGPVPVHLKLDTGMHRVGADAGTVLRLARAVAGEGHLFLEGLFTHFAVADQPLDPYTGGQVAKFRSLAAALAAEGIRPPLIHAANSAGALFHPEARFSMVRAGIAAYGLAPAAHLQGLPETSWLKPALSLKAAVSYVKELPPGERLSYGLHYTLPARSLVATVPIGYADGAPRRLFERGGEVLVRGRRAPIAGAVTMDQLLVDCGPATGVHPGDEVVLIGRQGGEEITAWEWAEKLGTIAYEVTCGLSARLPRTYLGHLAA
jgi:alanine racemase